MIKIDEALSGVVRLGLDTAPVIYFIEANRPRVVTTSFPEILAIRFPTAVIERASLSSRIERCARLDISDCTMLED